MAINDVLKDMYKKNTGKDLTEEAKNVEDTLKAINKDITLGGGGGYDSKKKCELLIDSILGNRSWMPSGKGPSFEINSRDIFYQLAYDSDLFIQEQGYHVSKMINDILNNREFQMASEFLGYLETAFLNQEYEATDGTIITDIFASETLDYEAVDKTLTRAYSFLEFKQYQFLLDKEFNEGYLFTTTDSFLSMFTCEGAQSGMDGFSINQVMFELLPNDREVSEIAYDTTVVSAGSEYRGYMEQADSYTDDIVSDALSSFKTYLNAIFTYIHNLSDGAERTALLEYKSIKFLRALVCVSIFEDPITDYGNIDFSEIEVDRSILWFIYKITSETDMNTIYHTAMPTPMANGMVFVGQSFIEKMCKISTYIKGL